MPLKVRYGIFVLLLVLGGIIPTQMPTAQAQQAIGADLFYLAPDTAGVTQVWKVDGNNSITQISNETANVVAYDVAYNNTVAYVTDRSLSVNGSPVTAGGPLDSPNLRLVDIAWAPTAGWVAVVALANPETTVDPSEGVWLYRLSDQSWRLASNSTKSDPNNVVVYTGVDWAETGDRLILNARFSVDTAGVTILSLSTGFNLVYNQGGTQGIIDPKGYGRGSISLDGTSIVLSDVPGAPVGKGFIVDINNYTRIIALIDDGALQSRYLSHAVPIRGGVAFFIRDFGNAITTSEVWQLSYTGARVALGSIPNADLGFDVDWTEDGVGLVYINQVDQATGLGTPHIFQRVGDIMQEVSLPSTIGKVRAVQFGPKLSQTGFSQVVDVKATEPLIAFQDEGGSRYYSLRLQWNSVSGGNGTYRITTNPGFDGQGTFDVQGVAAKFNKMQCGNTYTISVAAYDASGTAGADSQPINVTIPPCDAPVYPVLVDIYTELGSAAQAATSQTAAPTQAAGPTPTAAVEPLPTPVVPAAQITPTSAAAFTPEVLQPGSEQGGPATVTEVTLGQPVQEGNFYAVDVSWSPPQQAVQFFLVAVSPPYTSPADGALRPRFPIQFTQGALPIVAHIPGLSCGVTYTFTVQSVSNDGIAILSNSPSVSATMPPC